MQQSEPTPNSAGQSDTRDLLEALAVPGLGPVTARRLIERFGSCAAARAARPEALRHVGLKAGSVRALRAGELQHDPSEIIDQARELGIRLLAFDDPEYPPALGHWPDAPLVLFVRGGLLERDALAVAIVGTRRASLYGRMQAERLGFDLAQSGFTVVSGLARGVDAAAHQGALKGNGRTVAVLGNGLAHVYPPEHAELAAQVAENGALVSELPPDTPPTATNFPARNRIIAGLSLGVVVVEAPKRSGALITARLAGEMGKEVFAVPGDVTRPQTRGAHQLLRDGATLVESVTDIIEELSPLAQPVRVSEAGPEIPDPRALILNANERAVYDLLDASPRDIDAITRASRLSPANVASILMVLELKRLAVQLPGKRFVRAGTFQRDA